MNQVKAKIKPRSRTAIGQIDSASHRRELLFLEVNIIYFVFYLSFLKNKKNQHAIKKIQDLGKRKKMCLMVNTEKKQ